MAQLVFDKEVQIDSVSVKVSNSGTNYYYVHLNDLSSGDSVRYSCSEGVYNQVKDSLPISGHIKVRFQSWYDDSIKRGGQREYVFNFLS